MHRCARRKYTIMQGHLLAPEGTKLHQCLIERSVETRVDPPATSSCPFLRTCLPGQNAIMPTKTCMKLGIVCHILYERLRPKGFQ